MNLLAITLAILALAADVYVLYMIADQLAQNSKLSNASYQVREERNIALAAAVFICVNSAFVSYFILGFYGLV